MKPDPYIHFFRRSFIVGFHKFMRNRFPSTVSDHCLYRLVSGLLLTGPEVATGLDDLCAHLLNEMRDEYACADVRSEQSDLAALVEEFSPYFKAKFFKELADLVSGFFSKVCAFSAEY